MTDFQINDHLLTQECKQLAADILEELQRDEPEANADELRDDAYDRVSETADGHNWVIYTHKAIMICAHCNTDQGETFLEDSGMPDDVTFGGLATIIAYGEMFYRTMQELEDLLDEMENAA